jgi:hypothetical protein
MIYWKNGFDYGKTLLVVSGLIKYIIIGEIEESWDIMKRENEFYSELICYKARFIWEHWPYHMRLFFIRVDW